MSKKRLPIREVDTLPEDAAENEVVLLKSDESFYVAVKTSKGIRTIMKKEVGNGDNLEETSL